MLLNARGFSASSPYYGRMAPADVSARSQQRRRRFGQFGRNGMSKTDGVATVEYMRFAACVRGSNIRWTPGPYMPSFPAMT